MGCMGPSSHASRPGGRAAAIASAVGLALAWGAAGCAYSYDDGFAPLGQREASSSAAASASAQEQAQRAQTARSALGDTLTGAALEAWAASALPDNSGLSLAAGAGAVAPDRSSPRMTVDTDPGAATLHYACRGLGLAAVRVTSEESALLDITFTCNRPWSRALEVPAAGHLDIVFSSAGDAAANVAYRLTRP